LRFCFPQFGPFVFIKTSPFIEIPQPNYTLGWKAAEEMIKLIGSSPGTIKKAENNIKTITVTAVEEA